MKNIKPDISSSLDHVLWDHLHDKVFGDPQVIVASPYHNLWRVMMDRVDENVVIEVQEQLK